MIDICEEEIKDGNTSSLTKALEVNIVVLFNKIAPLLQLCEELGSKVDPIRRKYWEYVSRRLKLNYCQKREKQTHN